MKKIIHLMLLSLFALTAFAQQQTTDDLLKALNTGMVAVQGGTYTMGCTPGQGKDCYDKAHQVTVKNFSISKFLVTQAAWRAVMGNNPSPYFTGCDSCPVVEVSWNDAQAFITKLNSLTGQKYRLPTEAEWEYAARAGGKTEVYASIDSGIDAKAWYYNNSGNRPRPVGKKEANGLGLYDMMGDVWEWCADWYGTYSDSANYLPQGAGYNRVLRGGSWRNDASDCRVAYRNADAPDDRFTFGGFRLARD